MKTMAAAALVKAEWPLLQLSSSVLLNPYFS